MTTPDKPSTPVSPPEARAFPEGSVTVRCRLDGPLVVELPPDAEAKGMFIRVTDHLGTEYPIPAGKKAVAFCRCDETRNRPFCDGSHKTCGFQAAETAP
jgi:CDGSH-type Zn-finger protein